MTRESRYLIVALAAAVASVLLIAGINVLVDPYLIFDQPRVLGFNALKPAVEARESMMKAYQASRANARTVLLGSSRTGIGLDPESNAWPKETRPVYNLGLVGSSLPGNLDYFRRTFASRPRDTTPRLVIAGLDFESYLYDPRSTPSAGAQPASVGEAQQIARLDALRSRDARMIPALPILRDYAAATASLEALGESFATLLANRVGDSPDLGPSGRLSDARLQGWTAALGTTSMFRQTNCSMVKRLRRPKHVMIASPNEPIRGLEAVDELFEIARANQMEVVLFVQPSHAWRLELLEAMGYWADYERWKRAVAERVASAIAIGTNVSLFDFGGYESYALEEVPLADARSHTLRWFWDPVHYRSDLGDEMIKTMLGGNVDFARRVRVAPEAIDAQLSAIRDARTRYLRGSPFVREEAARLVRDLKACG